MQELRPPNSCRRCGSTNYHHRFARDAAGVLRRNGSYQCSGCQLTFTRPSEWRGIALEGAASAHDLGRAAAPARPGSSPL